MIWLTRLPFWPKHFVDLEVVTSLVDYPSGCQKCNVKERNITEIRLHLINHSYPKHRYIWKLFLKLIVDTKLLSTILSKINLICSILQFASVLLRSIYIYAYIINVSSTSTLKIKNSNAIQINISSKSKVANKTKLKPLLNAILFALFWRAFKRVSLQ